MSSQKVIWQLSHTKIVLESISCDFTFVGNLIGNREKYLTRIDLDFTEVKELSDSI